MKISRKFQVVIPKDIRERMGLKPGQEMQVIYKGGLIILVPERPIASLRGFVKGISTDGFREKKDRV